MGHLHIGARRTSRHPFIELRRPASGRNPTVTPGRFGPGIHTCLRPVIHAAERLNRVDDCEAVGTKLGRDPMMRVRVGGLVLLLASCTPAAEPPAPAVETPVGWQAETGGGPTWPDAVWWRGFHSPELDRLIEAARGGNLDIAAAIARVRQADAQVRIAGAALLPTLDATANASWQQVGVTRGLGTGSSTRSVQIHNYSLGLNAAYQVDFWGKNRAAQQSAIASAVFSRWDQEVVALTVVTNVAATWFNALAFADRVAIAERNLRDSQQTLAVIQGRLEVGTATALDQAQQQALVDGVRASIPPLRSQLQQQLLALGILIGRPPETVVEMVPGAAGMEPGTLTD